MHNSNPDMANLMRKAAELLNLKEHVVGLHISQEPKALCGPCDVEGHKVDEIHININISLIILCTPRAPMINSI